MKFRELLQDYHISTAPEGHHHARQGWVQFDCPFCAGMGAHKYHMGYNIAFGYVNCWRCGRHNITDTLVEVLGIEAKAIHKLLKDVDLDKSLVKVKHRGKLVVPLCVGRLERPHRRYLKRRGFDPKHLVKLWDIGGIGLRGMGHGLAWRLYIPITLYGEVVSFTTRSISDKVKKKYRAATEDEEALSSHELLYGADYCRGTALVFEGPPDVWRVGPGAVCTFGTQWNLMQVLKLAAFPRRVICYDNEVVAQKRARDLANLLAHQPGETFLMTLSRKGRDINDEELKKIRKRWL